MTTDFDRVLLDKSLDAAIAASVEGRVLHCSGSAVAHRARNEIAFKSDHGTGSILVMLPR